MLCLRIEVAQAHMILAEAVLGMSERPFVQGMFKEAQRDCRDVLVLRCRCRARPGDRRAFLEAAKDAFGVQKMGTELRAVLLLAYHKLAKKSQTVARRFHEPHLHVGLRYVLIAKNVRSRLDRLDAREDEL